MKNTSIRTVTYATSIVGAAIILIAAFVAVRYASTTQQISQINQSENTFDAALINRLTQRKIPFQRVAMNDKGEAWIVLSSTTETKNLPPEESLYFADVLRDATILKRRFPALVSLTIETLNAAHEQIDWQTLFVRLEDFPQPLTLDVSPKISEDEVAQLIGSMISSFQLPIKNKRIGVVKDVVSQTESQIVTIELEVSDSTEANSFLTGLIYDLRARMQDFNPKTGANVGAYKIIVKDQENNVLVAYQWDLDFRREISNMVKGIEPWVSMPPPAK